MYLWLMHLLLLWRNLKILLHIASHSLIQCFLSVLLYIGMQALVDNLQFSVLESVVNFSKSIQLPFLIWCYRSSCFLLKPLFCQIRTAWGRGLVIFKNTFTVAFARISFSDSLACVGCLTQGENICSLHLVPRSVAFQMKLLPAFSSGSVGGTEKQASCGKEVSLWSCPCGNFLQQFTANKRIHPAICTVLCKLQLIFVCIAPLAFNSCFSILVVEHWLWVYDKPIPKPLRMALSIVVEKLKCNLFSASQSFSSYCLP